MLEAKPRTCRQQINGSNLPADDVSEYYKRSITIPLIDHLNSELRDRFDTSTMVAYEGLCLIPSKLISLLNKHTKLNWKERFHCFANFYEGDLPNILALDAELDLWEKCWVTYKDCHPNNISTTLKAISFPGFENIKVALRILATLPVTSCECERPFSALRRLKNYNRSTIMIAERLNGLALMHIHRDIEPDVEEIINKFAVRPKET